MILSETELTYFAVWPAKVSVSNMPLKPAPYGPLKSDYFGHLRICKRPSMYKVKELDMSVIPGIVWESLPFHSMPIKQC